MDIRKLFLIEMIICFILFMLLNNKYAEFRIQNIITDSSQIHEAEHTIDKIVATVIHKK